MKQRDWYMEGWVYRREESGKSRKKLVYTGKYYSFSLPKKKLFALKAAALGLTLLMYAGLAAISLLPSLAGRAWYGGFFAMLALIPYMYLGMGAFCLASAKDEMTYRSYYASVLRIRTAAKVSAVLLGLAFTGQLIAMIVRLARGLPNPAAEWLWLSGVLVCAGAACGLLYLLSRCPVTVGDGKGQG